MASQIQAVAFGRSAWSRGEAREWLAEHGLVPIKIHTTKSYIRFRLRAPEAFDHFTTKTLPGGIRLVIGWRGA